MARRRTGLLHGTLVHEMGHAAQDIPTSLPAQADRERERQLLEGVTDAMTGRILGEFSDDRQGGSALPDLGERQAAYRPLEAATRACSTLWLPRTRWLTESCSMSTPRRPSGRARSRSRSICRRPTQEP